MIQVVLEVQVILKGLSFVIQVVLEVQVLRPNIYA